jgi:sugar lactone lactonase YvrE
MRGWRAVCAAVATTLAAAGPAGAQSGTYTLPGNAVFPEGVAATGSTFYVSSAADGTIFRGRLGQPQAQVFLLPGVAGRTSAAGLKVDEAGRIYVSGGATGRLFVYRRTGRLIRGFETAAAGETSFINDVALSPRGHAYFTDSFRPVIFRVSRAAARRPGTALRLRPWLSLAGTSFRYGTFNGSRFNANGVAATPDGRYLIVVQSNTGLLYRINIAKRRVTQIRSAVSTPAGDGILLRGRVLYVVRNTAGLVQKLRLSRTYGRATNAGSFTDPSFAFPTTIAQARGRLLVVNSQFDKMATANPVLPFTVSSLPLR